MCVYCSMLFLRILHMHMCMLVEFVNVPPPQKKKPQPPFVGLNSQHTGVSLPFKTTGKTCDRALPPFSSN